MCPGAKSHPRVYLHCHQAVNAGRQVPPVMNDASPVDDHRRETRFFTVRVPIAVVGWLYAVCYGQPAYGDAGYCLAQGGLVEPFLTDVPFNPAIGISERLEACVARRRCDKVIYILDA